MLTFADRRWWWGGGEVVQALGNYLLTFADRVEGVQNDLKYADIDIIHA